MTDSVLVIGAGPAGIASAYFLGRAGIPYLVLDRAPVLASTWANLYPSLRLNTTRFYSHLPGRRFPWWFGLFPTAHQYHRYLEQFVHAHRLNIRLGVAIARVFPEGDGWRAETSAGSSWHPAVILATGRFSCPYTPPIPGHETFSGMLLHACDYRGPEPFAGRRVMVVGNGPSGVDIVTDLGAHAARPVLLAQRTGIVLRPRYPRGLPEQVWMMLAERLPAPLSDSLLRWVESAHFDRLEQIGIKVPCSEAESSAAGATRGAELIQAVRGGRVVCVNGPARCEGPDVVLTDGSRHRVDALILATGYRPALFNYLDLGDVQTNHDGWPLRVDEPPNDMAAGKREVAGWPGLYLVGTHYLGKGALCNSNVEAAAAAREIGERLRACTKTPHPCTPLPHRGEGKSCALLPFSPWREKGLGDEGS
ncbi:MAG: NAD(P)/FAD-dependent oxidoreductase [Anaerolineae bacterium]|nr:NAD(P)/FAD-dependent oxidoreductase [Anaerolineae bacterium]